MYLDNLMTFFIPDAVTVQQVMAVIAILQRGRDVVVTPSKYMAELFYLAGIDCVSSTTQEDLRVLDLQVSVEAGVSYPEALAFKNKIPLTLVRDVRTATGIAMGMRRAIEYVQQIEFPNLITKPPEASGIVLCPFAEEAEVSLSAKVWVAVSRMLRSYGLPVYLVGHPGERYDLGAFPENAIFSEHSIADKLALLRAAKLVVGVPNAWTWAATSGAAAIVTMYPENVPSRWWFPWAEDRYGRILVDRTYPVYMALAGLRRVLAEL